MTYKDNENFGSKISSLVLIAFFFFFHCVTAQNHAPVLPLCNFQ